MNRDTQEERGAAMSRAGVGDTFAEILQRRLSRRGLLKGALTASALLMSGAKLLEEAQASPSASSLRFDPIRPDASDQVTVPAGYRVRPLVRWGDRILPGAPPFDPYQMTAQAQAQQFGYNCDFVGFLPLPLGSNNSTRGLLVVNHEYTNPEIMFPDYDPKNPTRQQVDVELAAHGLSVVEVQRGEDGLWSVVLDSRFNRRITATTPCTVTGPAAGNPWMQTSADPSGTKVAGTLNNCAGGKTPWGTVLSGEENFHQYFAHRSRLASDSPRTRDHQRYGLPEGESERKWERHHSRFHLEIEPNEPFRFGWVVEIDPYDPTSTPKKRTALGRFKHEAATIAIATSGQVALYSGDDERFEYVYKFVTARPYNSQDRLANRDILDEGTLYVARFKDDGSGEWLPLVYGQGPLTEANGFASQGDVLIQTRRAADLLGATKMDRPEDIETNPKNGKVYLVMTNNVQRGTPGKAGTDRANPRAQNRHGHIIELTEAGNNYAATTFIWNMFLVCGDPKDETTYFAGFDKSQVSTISCPDNITFDLHGNLWIATDGQEGTLKVNDGLFAVPVEGAERGHLRQFFSAVRGSEVCGPEFTPDNTTLFVAVQHPGEGERATFQKPNSLWPDGKTPPRPTVVAIQAENGGRIGEA
jgi:secreted PhoX family phosphatase